MRTLKWIALAAISCLAACNVTVGQCWIDENGNSEPDPGEPGAGDGPVVPPGGTGDNGDAPQRKPQDASNNPPCELIGSYDASLFVFKTTLADDGTDVAGGYQEATALSVKFVDGRQDPPAAWTCSVWVGMPIRTEKYGTISPQRAAEISAEVLTTTASITMHSRESWVQALFCKQLATDMVTVFGKVYNKLGASARAQ